MMQSEPLAISPAAHDDLDAINDIYNHFVQCSTCTYQEEPETIAARIEWFEHHGPRHPVIVARLDSTVVGWGSLSPLHPRSAYRNSVENSVYVRHDMHGRGVGSAILTELIHRAREIGHHTIIAGADAEQIASLALHKKFGFVEVCRFRQVGYKFDRWLDVIYMQLML